jgi:PHD/YefM family antitoxin component YafN of YafNO toxin-antitoxin module
MSELKLKHITPTKLRANIYKILDEIIATGKPVTVDRNGEKIVLIKTNKAKKTGRADKNSEEEYTKLSRLRPMNILAEGVTDEDLIYESVAEWDGEPELNR